MKIINTLLVLSLLTIGAGCSNAEIEGKTALKMPNGNKIHVEVARTLTEQSQGLSGKQDIGDGMLFCMQKREEQKFWMLGMETEIDMVWINDGLVTGVSENVPIRENDDWARRTSGEIVNMVLEVPAGMAKEYGLTYNTMLEDIYNTCKN